MKWLRRRIIASVATQTAETFLFVAVLAFALLRWRTEASAVTVLFAAVLIGQIAAILRLGMAMRNNPLSYGFMRKYVDEPFTYRVSRFTEEDKAHRIGSQLMGFSPVATIRDAEADPEPVFDVYHDPSRLVAASVSRASGSVTLISSLSGGRMLITDARAVPPREALVVNVAAGDDLGSLIDAHRRALSGRSDVTELDESAHQVVLDSLMLENETYNTLGPALSSFLDLETSGRSLRLAARLNPKELADLPRRLGPELLSPAIESSTPEVAAVVTVPEVAAVAVPDVPEVAVPEVAAVAVPEVPSVAVPDVPDVPEVAVPDVPSVAVSEVAAVVLPEVTAIDFASPNITRPEITVPDVAMPQQSVVSTPPQPAAAPTPQPTIVSLEDAQVVSTPAPTDAEVSLEDAQVVATPPSEAEVSIAEILSTSASDEIATGPISEISIGQILAEADAVVVAPVSTASIGQILAVSDAPLTSAQPVAAADVAPHEPVSVAAADVAPHEPVSVAAADVAPHEPVSVAAADVAAILPQASDATFAVETASIDETPQPVVTEAVSAAQSAAVVPADPNKIPENVPMIGLPATANNDVDIKVSTTDLLALVDTPTAIEMGPEPVDVVVSASGDLAEPEAALNQDPAPATVEIAPHPFTTSEPDAADIDDAISPITVEMPAVAVEPVAVESVPVIVEPIAVESVPVAVEPVAVESVPVAVEPVAVESVPVAVEPVAVESVPVVVEPVAVESVPVVNEPAPGVVPAVPFPEIAPRVAAPNPANQPDVPVMPAPVVGADVPVMPAPVVGAEVPVMPAPVVGADVPVMPAPRVNDLPIPEQPSAPDTLVQPITPPATLAEAVVAAPDSPASLMDQAAVLHYPESTPPPASEEQQQARRPRLSEALKSHPALTPAPPSRRSRRRR